MKSVCTGLALVFVVLQSWAQREEKLYVGWNHLFEIGADMNQALQINPKVGQEGSVFRWGITFNMRNLFLDSRDILENKITIDLGANRNSSEAWYDSTVNKRFNPFKKNYDQIIWRTKYSREFADERFYLAAEHFFSTTLLPSFQDGYFRQVSNDSEKLSSFLSPMSSTFSIGVEMRNEFFYSIYLSPVALKVIYIKNGDIARIPALNESRDLVEFLGSGIHGNEIVYDLENQRVVSFKKSRYFFGTQLLLNYDRELISDRLKIKNESRIFFDYLDKPSVDLNLRTELSFVIIKGLQLAIVSELIKDDNLFFQSSRKEDLRDPQRIVLRRGTSYSQRLLLRYRFGQ